MPAAGVAFTRITALTDVFGILVSGLLMLLVVFRAFQLDSKLPWFQAHKPPATTDDPADAKAAGGTRYGRPNRVP